MGTTKYNDLVRLYEQLEQDYERLRAALDEIHAKPYRAEEVTARIFAAAHGDAP